MAKAKAKPEPERALPARPELERELLGGILLWPESFHDAGAELTAQDFIMDSHRRIFTAIASLVEDGQPIEMILLVERLRATHELEAIGGIGYLASLTDGVPKRTSLAHHVTVLQATSRRRRTMLALMAATNAIMDPGESTEDIVAAVSSELLAVAGEAQRKKIQRVAEFSAGVFEELEKTSEFSMDLPSLGYPTGFKKLDECITGYRKGEYYVIGAYTSDGKTSLMVQGSLANLQAGKTVGVFSIEMTKQQLLLRALAAVASVPFIKLRDSRQVPAHEVERWKSKKQILDDYPWWIDDTGSIEIHQLLARARYMVERLKCEVIFVDYIQRVHASKYQKRYEAVSHISQELCEFAKSGGVPVVVLSQLSRPDQRKKAPPTLYMLKESGDIEQDAHAVIMPYRPVNENEAPTGQDMIYVRKQRNGPTGALAAKYNTSYLIYEDREETDHGN